MIAITGYRVELLKDPFGILTGERYEFFLDIDVPEDDELFSEKGLYIRVLYTVGEHQSGIVKYEIIENETEQSFNFELEEEETAAIDSFCKGHLNEY
ncbi:pullulanase [Peribacillus cavernae]|uniref:Pullulanase n=1 Tax=Peribacillus cavernae TaxID=1674310 RepID=A0A3S0U5C1_9BACI|nr:DUF6509 family protein [Peribacillus cavernae]MDQ0217017.1 hypothetical protein [Peribacillus cavernae]RUQ30500.1 pullulanase [Peribacillus cavernae]